MVRKIGDIEISAKTEHIWEEIKRLKTPDYIDLFELYSRVVVEGMKLEYKERMERRKEKRKEESGEQWFLNKMRKEFERMESHKEALNEKRQVK